MLALSKLFANVFWFFCFFFLIQGSVNFSSLEVERQNGEVMHQYADNVNAVEAALRVFAVVLSPPEVVGFLLNCGGSYSEISKAKLQDETW